MVLGLPRSEPVSWGELPHLSETCFPYLENPRRSCISEVRAGGGACGLRGVPWATSPVQALHGARAPEAWAPSSDPRAQLLGAERFQLCLQGLQSWPVARSQAATGYTAPLVHASGEPWA